MFDKIIYKREKRLQSFFIDATGNICFEMDLAGVWLNSGNSFLEITSVTGFSHLISLSSTNFWYCFFSKFFSPSNSFHYRSVQNISTIKHQKVTTLFHDWIAHLFNHSNQGFDILEKCCLYSYVLLVMLVVVNFAAAYLQ